MTALDPTFCTLLRLLQRGGQYSYYWLVSQAKDAKGQALEKRTLWYQAGNPAELPPEVNGRGPHHSYFGVHPVAAIPTQRTGRDGETYTPRPEKVRPLIEEIAAINGVYADFDAKDFEGGKAEALDYIEVDLGERGIPAPTALTDTGGGYQGFWIFDEPFILDTPEKRLRAIRLQERWVTLVGADSSVTDLPRVLRAVQSHNYKYDPAPLVTFVAADFDRRFTIGELEALIPMEAPRPAPAARVAPLPLLADHLLRWVNQILDRACTGVLSAPQGKGSDVRVEMGKLAGGTAFTGVYSDNEIIDRLLPYALQRSSDSAVETERNLRNGLEYGKASPLPLPIFPTSQPLTLDSAGVAHCPSCDTRVLVSKFDYPGTSTPGWYCPECKHPMVWPREAYTPQGGAAAASDEPATKVGTDTTRLTQSERIIAQLAAWGYTFRLNKAGHIMECSGQPMDDALAATVRTQYRDAGLKNIKALEDAYYAEASRHAYHPVQDYLNSLLWDGHAHISRLSTYLVSDDASIAYADGVARSTIGTYLYRWLIGAVAKVFDRKQNSMLVLGGPQGIGKSYFVRWLASPLPDYYIEAAIQPDDKDSVLRFATSWIWEVGEIAATTRRADREALKAALTKETITLRKAYGHYDTRAPAMASFIGTFNPDHAGFLDDPTGSRRFWVVTLTNIDRRYSKDIDIHQVWAEAVAAYRRGVPWELRPEEEGHREALNEEHEVEDPMLGLLEHFFILDADASCRMDSSEMMLHLRDKEAPVSFHNPRALAMDIARALKKRGVRKAGDGKRRYYLGVMKR